MTAAPDDWRHRAACRDTPLPLMFPDDGATADIIDAKRVCQSCPVRLECLTYAMTANVGGVAGGTTERERLRLARQVAAGHDSLAARAATIRFPRRRPHDPAVNPRTAGIVARPELLTGAGVHVTADGTVTIDDVSWLVARIVLQRRGAWPPVAHRHLLEGVLHKHGHGIGWRYVPAAYGKWETVRKMHDRLTRRGWWADVLGAVGVDPAADPTTSRGALTLAA